MTARLPANQLDRAAHSHPARQSANWLEANSPNHGVDQLPLFGWFIVESLSGRFLEALFSSDAFNDGFCLSIESNTLKTPSLTKLTPLLFRTAMSVTLPTPGATSEARLAS